MVSQYNLNISKSSLVIQKPNMNEFAASITRVDEKSNLTFEQVIDGPASYLKFSKEIRQQILSNVFSVSLHHDNLDPCPYETTYQSFEPWKETENWKEEEETEHTRIIRQGLTIEQEVFGGDDPMYFRMRRIEMMIQRMEAGLDNETLESNVTKIRILKRIQKMMAEKTVALEVKRFETLADRMNEVLSLEKGTLAKELREEVALVLEMRKKGAEEMVEECCRGDGWLMLGEECTISKHTSGGKAITLLTLPREIRQKILHLSCGLGIKARTEQPRVNYPWFSKVGWQMRVDEHNETHGILEKQRSNNWAELLSYVSDNIAFREDVQWVTEKWGKEIEDVVKEHQVIWVMRARYWKGI
ncbi:Autophagy-related protein 13 [Venturia nashicola]|nr:Autophagy-related protein 13 [Venturia nashicola]